MKFVLSEVRRARPLLGTFVEITAGGNNEARLHRAIDHAFDTVERVHRLMSFHDPASDVSRVNREGFHKGVTVHPWTWQVLQAAREFARESEGTFDVSVAPLLTKWNYLPRRAYSFDKTATWRDIFLRRNYVVFCRRPVVVDLGGIAKGFAVDKAVAALKAYGVPCGLVNAGGDLRAFGLHPYPVEIRHPDAGSESIAHLQLRAGALATSARHYAEKQFRRRVVSPIVDPHTRRVSSNASATVRAKTCVCADALTKLVMLRGSSAFPFIKKLGAEALLVTKNGQTLHSSGWK